MEGSMKKSITHRLSRLLVHVRMGKSCIMLAPRSILKHTECEEESNFFKAEQRLKHKHKGRAVLVPARLTGNAAPTDSGTLKHPRKTEGCRIDVWEDREGSGRGSFRNLQFNRLIPTQA